MKLSTLIATATFGLVASAAPIRVILLSPIKTYQLHPISPNVEASDPSNIVRLGHAAANAKTLPAAIPWRSPPIWSNAVETVPARRPTSGCGGLRAMGNKWRQILGMPPIQYDALPHVSPGEVRIMPITSGRMVSPRPAHRLHHRPSFMTRLHRALNQLGTWEGRAVSFVLGCGIGVLIRMFFVFAVLLFRSRRRENAEVQTGAIYLPAEEVIFVAPEYPEEKVPEYVESETATETVEEKKEGEEATPTA